MPAKILLLGLDSATWDLLNPWMAQGLLPNLAALRERGAWAGLRSTVLPLTAPAWTTLLTGRNQGKHGIYDFTRRKVGSYGLEMTNASMVGAPTLYDYLSVAGRRVASINMPYTFPPRPLNGLLVSGLFATVTGPAITYPAELWQEIAHVAPRYCIAPDYDAGQTDPLWAYLQAMLDSIEQRTLAAEHLLRREEWDLFALIYTETDEIQHAFWHCLPGAPLPQEFADHPDRFGNPILTVYQRLDAQIPRVLELAGPDTMVWVVSDHGAGPLSHLLYLNRALAGAGLLKFSEQGQVGRASRLAHLARLYKRAVPNATRARVRQLLGGGAFERIKGEFESRMFRDAINWSATRVYGLGWGNIYVNLRGREPEGIVEPGAEYEQVCAEATACLLALRHPDSGEPLVDRVYRREELYQGPVAEAAPDLVIWPDSNVCGRGGFDAAHPELFQRCVTAEHSDLPLTGAHRRMGIVVAAGNGIGAHGRLADADIADIAPSILAAAGLAVPDDMDGQVLREWIGVTEQAADVATSVDDWQPPAYEYSAEEEAIIQRRLEDLGYL